MSVHLPPRKTAFPRPEARPAPAHAWGSQWKYLHRSPRVLLRDAMRNGLRRLRG
ncbi:hypothetical protein [Novosphingobium olei]|uniref:Uncharacterized protein n=1 Tax=Novosphingobium olei TaxID=2728851 RepID=A0A7Y0GBG5_9SPHN|nr:hypothetical protein [Novosphingobium olei]NML94612.1 hypothetical protein [Novosphingobium olei]